MQQAGDGPFGLSHLRGGGCQRTTLQVMQRNGNSLRLGQRPQSVGQPQQVFVPDRLPAGRSLVGGEHPFDALRRLGQRFIQRAFPSDVALLATPAATRVAKVVGEDGAKPRRPLVR